MFSDQLIINQRFRWLRMNHGNTARSRRFDTLIWRVSRYPAPQTRWRPQAECAGYRETLIERIVGKRLSRYGDLVTEFCCNMAKKPQSVLMVSGMVWSQYNSLGHEMFLSNDTHVVAATVPSRQRVSSIKLLCDICSQNAGAAYNKNAGYSKPWCKRSKAAISDCLLPDTSIIPG